MPPWIVFTVLRLVLFAGPLAIMLVCGVEPWIAALSAALIGLSLSTVLLARQRRAVALALYNARHPANSRVRRDEQSEDAAVAPARSPRCVAHAVNSESERSAKNQGVEDTRPDRQS